MKFDMQRIEADSELFQEEASFKNKKANSAFVGVPVIHPVFKAYGQKSPNEDTSVVWEEQIKARHADEHHVAMMLYLTNVMMQEEDGDRVAVKRSVPSTVNVWADYALDRVPADSPVGVPADGTVSIDSIRNWDGLREVYFTKSRDHYYRATPVGERQLAACDCPQPSRMQLSAESAPTVPKINFAVDFAMNFDEHQNNVWFR